MFAYATYLCLNKTEKRERERGNDKDRKAHRMREIALPRIAFFPQKLHHTVTQQNL